MTPRVQAIRDAVQLREDDLVRDEILYLPLALIDPDPEQPRLDVDAELADSIAQHGVLQPIQVRPHPTEEGRWYLVDGERRYRGSLAAKLATIPAQLTLEVEDAADRLVRQLVRNTGKPLTPFEEAQAYQRIIAERRAAGETKYGVTQLAQELGKSKSTVSDRVALAEAPAPFLPLFRSGELSVAAAPIVRRFSAVPTEILKRALTEVREDYEWQEARNDKRSVPLETVEERLNISVIEQLYELEPDVRKRYDGPTVKVKRWGRDALYAIDVEQAKRIEQELAEARRAKEAKQSAKARAPAEDDWAKRAAEQRKKKERARKEKRAEHEAQFAAIAARLPTTLDRTWLAFVIRWLLREMHLDIQNLACTQFGLEAVKRQKYGSPDYRGAIMAHVETLDDGRRVQLLLQLLLVSAAHVSLYSAGPADRFTDAAELLGIDLAAVKNETPGSNPLAAAPTPIAAELFSKFTTGTANKRLLKKRLDQWPNDVVRYSYDHALGQLAKYDDPAPWEPPAGINVFTREQAFLARCTRDQVASDLAHLEHAMRVRGLLADAPDPADGPACQYCECTHVRPCELDDGPCGWHSTDPPVCTNPDCLAGFQGDQQCAARDADEHGEQGEEATDDLWDRDEDLTEEEVTADE